MRRRIDAGCRVEAFVESLAIGEDGVDDDFLFWLNYMRAVNQHYVYAGQAREREEQKWIWM